MSSDGELFINEELHDLVADRIKKKIGKDWNLDISNYVGCWDRGEICSGEVDILVNEKPIGKVIFEVKPFVADDGYGRYIDVKIINFKIEFKEND